MPNSTLDEAAECAQRIRAGVEQAMCEFEGQKLKVTASLGVAEIVAGQSPTTLVQCADEALYDAKQAGRNQVQRYRNPAQQPVATANTLEPQPTENIPAEKTSVVQSAGATPADIRTDAQTGLPSRTAFCEDIHRRLSEAQRHGNRLSLLLLNVDKFDELTARHGAHAGDIVLRTCTQFLSAAMRDMDVVARYQTEVFGIILPGTSLAHAMGAGERMRAAIERCPLRFMDKDIRFTISGGVAEAQPGENFVSFITRTEAAKTAAMRGDGNKVRVHTGLTIEAVTEVAQPANA